MQPGEPILLICYAFPPNPGIGGRRWAKFAKEVAKRGHPVHVIRSAGRPGRMGSLWSADAEVPGITAHPLPPRYPGVMRKQPLTTLFDKVMYRLWSQVLPGLTQGNWYDAAVLWRRPLLREASELVHRYGIRNVIVTGAPFSLLGYGAELKERHPGIHLVSDFRDIWTWGKGYGYQTIGKERLRHDRELERKVTLVSDRVISPHHTVLEHLHQEHGGAPNKFVHIAHAIDPDDLDVDSITPADGMFRMIYAGSLYGEQEAERFFEVLFQAFHTLKKERPGTFAKCRLDYYITSHGTALYERMVRNAGLEEHIRFHAPLEPRELFSRITGSDLVLAFMPPDKKDVHATKFHEIFYLKCPILHVGDPGLVSRDVLEKRMGDTIRLEELVEELPRIISGERTVRTHPDPDHGAYLLSTVTDKLFNEVFD